MLIPVGFIALIHKLLDSCGREGLSAHFPPALSITSVHHVCFVLCVQPFLGVPSPRCPSQQSPPRTPDAFIPHFHSKASDFLDLGPFPLSNVSRRQLTKPATPQSCVCAQRSPYISEYALPYSESSRQWDWDRHCSASLTGGSAGCVEETSACLHVRGVFMVHSQQMHDSYGREMCTVNT